MNVYNKEHSFKRVTLYADKNVLNVKTNNKEYYAIRNLKLQSQVVKLKANIF